MKSPKEKKEILMNIIVEVYNMTDDEFQYLNNIDEKVFFKTCKKEVENLKLQLKLKKDKSALEIKKEEIEILLKKTWLKKYIEENNKDLIGFPLFDLENPTSEELVDFHLKVLEKECDSNSKYSEISEFISDIMSFTSLNGIKKILKENKKANIFPVYSYRLMIVNQRKLILEDFYNVFLKFKENGLDYKNASTLEKKELWYAFNDLHTEKNDPEKELIEIIEKNQSLFNDFINN